MERLRIFLARLLGFFRGQRGDAELNEEMQAHLDALAQREHSPWDVAAGSAAGGTAGVRGMEQVKEVYRDQRGLPFFDALAQDLRFALRMLAKAPSFGIVAIRTLRAWHWSHDSGLQRS